MSDLLVLKFLPFTDLNYFLCSRKQSVPGVAVSRSAHQTGMNLSCLGKRTAQMSQLLLGRSNNNQIVFMLTHNSVTYSL